MQQTWQGEVMLRRALVQARTFLERWNDPVTRNQRDDLAQEAVWAAMRRAGEVRDRSRFPAMIRTISRRLRHRAVTEAARGATVFGGDEGDLDLLPAPDQEGECLLVGGMPIGRLRLLGLLGHLLPGLGPLNSALIARFYEGFSCAELGEHYGLSEESVKVRIHRCRRRLRRRFEATIRAADGLVD